MDDHHVGSLLRYPLLWYGMGTPYFPGKWRTVEWVISRCRRLAVGSYVVKRHGLLWEVDLECLIQRSLYYLGWWEIWETKFFQAVLQPNWCVVDVGANIGYYSLLAAKKVGPGGSVYAFEPASNAYSQLVRNVRLNGIEWVRPVKQALSDAEGTAYMPVVPRRRQGAQGICFEANPDREEIKTTTLDVFVERTSCPQINFIKVDIEGSEAMFLKGAARTIQKHRPLLMLELNPFALARYQATPEEVMRPLSLQAYDLYTLRRHQLRPLKDLPQSAPGTFVNVLAVPKEQRHRFPPVGS